MVDQEDARRARVEGDRRLCNGLIAVADVYHGKDVDCHGTIMHSLLPRYATKADCEVLTSRAALS